MGSNSSHGRTARALVRACVPAEAQDDVLADLHDLRTERRAASGSVAAVIYYWRQLIVYALRAATGRARWSDAPADRGGIGAFLTDVRQALRGVRNGPAHAAIMIATLGVSIGAVTVVFSLLNSLLLAPLPFADIDRLVVLREVVDAPGRAPIWYTPTTRTLHVARELVPEIEQAGGHRFATYLLDGVDGRTQSIGVGVTAGFFETIGVEAELGSGFSAAEEASDGSARVALLERSLWQEALGGDPATIGGTIQLNGVPHILAGVLPAGFRFPWGARIWVLTEADPAVRATMGVVARLAPEVSAARFTAALRAATRTAARLYPDSHAEIRLESLPLRDYLVGNRDGISWLLFIAVGLLLLLACANVGGLATVRVLGRQRELAIRCAIGGGRARLFRLVFLEGATIAAAGGVLGLLLAWWLRYPIRTLTGAAQSGIGLVRSVDIDHRVLLFTVLATGAAALLASALPARRAVDVGRAGSLTRSRGVATDARTQRLLAAVVIGQAAVAATLITFAGAIGEAYLGLERSDRGYATEDRRAMRVVLPEEQYPGGAGRSEYLEELARRLAEQPEVVAAGYTHHLPMTPGNWPRQITVEGSDATRPTTVASARWVGTSYLPTLGLSMLAGRAFSADDMERRAPVVIVSAELADRTGLGRAIVGRRLRFGNLEDDTPWLQVIGVVAQAREEWTIRESFYLPYSRRTHEWVEMVVHERPGTGPERLAQVVSAIAPGQPVDDIRSLTRLGAEELRGEQLATVILACMALGGLAIAALGTYGLVSYRVGQQRHDLGVRMALGCTSGRLTWQVASRGVGRVLAGVFLGLPAAVVVLMPLFGHTPGVADLPEVQLLAQRLAIHPVNAAAVVLVIVVAATAACLGPALRAGRADPREVLAGD